MKKMTLKTLSILVCLMLTNISNTSVTFAETAGYNVPTIYVDSIDEIGMYYQNENTEFEENTLRAIYVYEYQNQPRAICYNCKIPSLQLIIQLRNGVLKHLDVLRILVEY